MRLSAIYESSRFVKAENGKLVDAKYGHRLDMDAGVFDGPHIKSKAYHELYGPLQDHLKGRSLDMGAGYTTADPPNSDKHIFYHGTTSARLESIQKNGLKSSEEVDQHGLGGQDAYDPTSVYLAPTARYATHAAGTTADRYGGVPIILEIDLSGVDESEFLPDDDFGETWADTYETGGIRTRRAIEPNRISIYAQAEKKDGQWVFRTKDDRQFSIPAY